MKHSLHGKEVIVDDIMDKTIIKLSWGLNNFGYFTTKFQNKHWMLHEMVIGKALKGMVIHHINGNKLDNRRENLEKISRSLNNISGPLMANNKTGFRGVSFWASAKKWVATIYKDQQKFHLGYFDSPEKAAIAYNQKSKELFGEKGFQNPI